MGRKTRDELVTEGLELAGDPSLTTRANFWLQSWLDTIYAQHSWSFLSRRFPRVDLLAAGTYADFGAGSGGTALDIARVNRIILTDGISDGYVGDAEVVFSDEMRAEDLPNRLRTAVGQPDLFIVEAEGTTPCRWRLYPNQTPDRAYSLTVFANPRPAALSTSTIPEYPSDMTMVQAICTMAMWHLQDERFTTSEQKLEALTAKDVLIYGRKPGTSNKLQLSRKRFRRA